MKIITDLLSSARFSFRQKIVLIAVSGIIIASIVYTVSAVRSEQRIMRDEFVKRAEVVTRLASQIGELPLISKNPELISKAISSLKSIQEISVIAFYDDAKQLLVKEGAFELPPMRFTGSSKMSIYEENDFFDLAAPVFTLSSGEDIDMFRDTEEVGAVRETVGWVRICFSKAFMKEAQRDIIHKGIIIAIAFTLGSIILFYKLFTVTAKPLAILSDAAKSISKGTYPEIPITSGDEIGTLTSEFNRMSSTIREREDMLVNQARLSSFIADIGMELTESETLEIVLQRCTGMMIQRLQATVARIWIYRTEEKSLELMAGSGIYSLSENQETGIPTDQFEAGKIAREQSPYLINEGNSLIREGRQWITEHGIVSYAGYPLIVEKRLIGVIEMFATKPISDNVLKTLDSVASGIALGMQHKLAELKIKASLHEKEVLLREIHHRVKNNMQIISSLINLQAQQIGDDQYVEMFNDSRNRIRSMALVHEKLYHSEDLSNISFRDYAQSLINDLFAFYETHSGQISIEADLEDIRLSIDVAIPCGLIINELVTNSFKHAFPGSRKGTIFIQFSRANLEEEEGFTLTVRDNGAGIPENLDIRNTKSLGLQLVTSLAEHQLRGTIEVTNDNGTEFRIQFKGPIYKQRI